MRTVVTTALDVVGVLLIAACVFFLWRPGALAVLGVAFLAASWQQARPPAPVVDLDETL